MGCGSAPASWQRKDRLLLSDVSQIGFVDHVLGPDFGRSQASRSDPTANCFGIPLGAASGFRDGEHCSWILQQTPMRRTATQVANRGIWRYWATLCVFKSQDLNGRRRSVNRKVQGSSPCPGANFGFRVVSYPFTTGSAYRNRTATVQQPTVVEQPFAMPIELGPHNLHAIEHAGRRCKTARLLPGCLVRAKGTRVP